MGPSPESLTRVVLDTSALVSGLLFSGPASRLVPLWQTGRIVPLVSRPILQEYIRVLAYPKFDLGRTEIRSLMEEELLPFVQTVRVTRRVAIARDPEDNKFLECALAGRARYLISGDKDLLALDPFRNIRIMSPADFLAAAGP